MYFENYEYIWILSGYILYVIVGVKYCLQERDQKKCINFIIVQVLYDILKFCIFFFFDKIKDFKFLKFNFLNILELILIKKINVVNFVNEKQ